MTEDANIDYRDPGLGRKGKTAGEDEFSSLKYWLSTRFPDNIARCNDERCWLRYTQKRIVDLDRSDSQFLSSATQRMSVPNMRYTLDREHPVQLLAAAEA